MLVHASGINRGDIPVKLYRAEEGSGCVFVGNESARIMLTPEEIRELHRLLGEFVSATKIKDRL